ncbi:MAG: efflux RND transporter permease subunit [Colwellia sp.]|nr:efflux RND transporter permease subunit [Colwellia sp.]
MWLRNLIQNHVLTNLAFVLILVMGIIVYQQLPREQDPSINFNWVQVTTFLPGASARDVEQKITDVIEESLERIQDIKFVSSSSREGLSSITVRFNDIDEQKFTKRMADLRREISNVEDRLPAQVESPYIVEITSANAFPTASVVVSGPADDENLRRQARSLEKDLARIPGVDRVQSTGQREPELQVQFDIEKIQNLGISPVDIANSIREFFVDTSAGSARIANDQWLIRIQGTTTDPEVLAQLPILSKKEQYDGTELRLKDIAKVVRAREKADRLVNFEGQPAVLFVIMKQESSNTLELVERINQYVLHKNKTEEQLGVKFTLVDDQTLNTRSALNTMQTNAMLGLVLVFFVTWLFLGGRISMLVTIGIPFTLAGTFIILQMLGQTLNTSVLLAIVIALGMLVDDAVVVVDSIYTKLRQGMRGIDAAWAGLNEVIRPVTASVLTTMAAFLPLMLLPGILGKFMMVIPLVVTVALAISLIEAYWMLPGHITAAKINFDKPSKFDVKRQKAIRRLKVSYGFKLIKVMRHPKKTLLALFILLSSAVIVVQQGLIRTDFFAADTIRLFYINVEMPTTSSINDTMKKVVQIEQVASEVLNDQDTRSVVSYAGQMFTELAPKFGDHLGQVMVSLKPRAGDMRTVEQLIEETRIAVENNIIGASNISFLKLSGGPPVSKPINVKVRGDDYAELRRATDKLSKFLYADDRFRDISDDDSQGRFGLNLTLNSDAINRLGIQPSDVQRTIKMLVDGEIASYVQHKGDRVAIRVKSSAAVTNQFDDIEALLQISMPTRSGDTVSLRDLVNINTIQVKNNLRHYNFKRTIALEADIDKLRIDTVAANKLIQDYWPTIAEEFPNVSLDFSGELDDIQESLDAIGVLFLFGLGLMYLILSTQFQSYFQPLMILMTVPMAFVGVVIGLLVSGDPLSLFTMYGIVALAGIAVNSSIMLISTANNNLAKGMSLIHAIFYAGRRRVLPILITTLTTVAGLFSLASGLGGHSLIWSPVATSIVWGLIFSSVLTLFIIPTLYQMVMQRTYNKRRQEEEKGKPPENTIANRKISLITSAKR